MELCSKEPILPQDPCIPTNISMLKTSEWSWRTSGRPKATVLWLLLTVCSMGILQLLTWKNTSKLHHKTKLICFLIRVMILAFLAKTEKVFGRSKVWRKSTMSFLLVQAANPLELILDSSPFPVPRKTSSTSGNISARPTCLPTQSTPFSLTADWQPSEWWDPNSEKNSEKRCCKMLDLWGTNSSKADIKCWASPVLLCVWRWEMKYSQGWSLRPSCRTVPSHLFRHIRKHRRIPTGRGGQGSNQDESDPQPHR